MGTRQSLKAHQQTVYLPRDKDPYDEIIAELARNDDNQAKLREWLREGYRVWKNRNGRDPVERDVGAPPPLAAKVQQERTAECLHPTAISPKPAQTVARTTAPSSSENSAVQSQLSGLLA